MIYSALAKYTLIIVLLLSGFSVWAQESKKDSLERNREKTEKKREDSIRKTKQITKKDSVERAHEKKARTPKDSTGLGKHVDEDNHQTKVGKYLSKWIFKDKSKDDGEDSDMPDKTDREVTEALDTLLDMKIRNIDVESYDPFGHDIEDTTKTPHSWFQKTGNAVHSKSRRMAIDKFLLFKEGEGIDTTLLRESSRLLRDQNYVRKVKFVPTVVEGTDSIDVTVRVLDSWSLLPKIKVTGNEYKFGAQERNFLGTGHKLEAYYSKRFEDGNNGYETAYTVPNIRNSFVDMKVKYKRDFDHFQDKYISVGRDFYSPLARWAGGGFMQERDVERPMFFDLEEFEYDDIRVKYFYQNYWAAYSWPVLEDFIGEERVTNLVAAARALQVNYRDRPPSEYDEKKYFSNEQFVLASASLNTREYIQDSYIFRDGDVEDVPVGSDLTLTGGWQRKNNENRFYGGARISYGDYFNFGFLSGTFEMGSFFKGGHSEETAISLKGNYFSDLMDLGGGWKMRQFAKPEIMFGINRSNSYIDRVGLNDNPAFKGVNNYKYRDYEGTNKYIDYKNGSITGFDSPIYGRHKFVLNLQTQFYTPWSFLGFHINPFANVTTAYLADTENSYGSNKFYSSYSLGVIIRNDYLVFSSIQLSLTYYPEMPGDGANIINTNALRTRDFGFQDFQPGEPHPVIYE